MDISKIMPFLTKYCLADYLLTLFMEANGNYFLLMQTE